MKRISKSSGNVFADIGLPDSDALLAKAKLVGKIADAIDSLGMSQQQVARRIGLPQPKVSDLLRGHFEGYSMERLFRILNALGYDVKVRTVRSSQSHARLAVN